MRQPVMFPLLVAALVAAAPPHQGWPERVSAITVEQSRDQRINLAVLRADGILLPFASFDRGDWRVSWPSDLTGRELPASVASVPREWWGGAEPESWRVFSSDGKSSPSVKLIAPVMIRIGIAVRLGFRTDHPPAKLNVPPFVMAFPKIGLAVAGDAGLQPISNHERSDPASASFLQPIRQALNDAEERTINALRVNTGWKHPFDKKIRTGLEADLEAWYSTALVESGARVSYIEVVKKYPPQPKDEGCGLETFITGWVLQSEKQGRPKTELKASVVYCDRDRASYMLPFGQISVSDRTYWIFQMSGHDHEWYAVAEATRSRVRVVAEYFAGAMPRNMIPNPR